MQNNNRCGRILKTLDRCMGLVWPSHVCRASFRSGVPPLNLSTIRLPQDASDWHMLSLEEMIDVLDQAADLLSVENYICILQKCRVKKDLAYAKRVHAHICDAALEAHRTIGNFIVPMFIECGSLADAQQVFSRLAHRNEHSWTSLIIGYIQCGRSEHALDLYLQMQEGIVHPSSFTFVALLKACGNLKNVARGREIHTEITKMGYAGDLVVGNTLVGMYAKCGVLSEAQDVFDKLLTQDVVSWTALIGGYAEHGHSQVALNCFEQMQLLGISPNSVTFICIVRACGSLGAADKCREIHTQITQKGFERHPEVCKTLVDMYVKSGSIVEAHEVFLRLSVWEIVLWTALMAGYAERGCEHEALECYEQIQQEGLSPDAVTFVSALKACGSIGVLVEGQEVHIEITQMGFENDLFVSSTLVGMYAKCGSLLEACEVFAKMQARDVVSWNAITGGFLEHGTGQEALEFLKQMQLENVFPNAVTLVCALKACGRIEAIDKGRDIYMEITQWGYDSCPLVRNTLIDMYAKCDSISEAREVFDKLPVREVVSWSALIAGYDECGSSQEALQCIEQMQLEGISLNAVTYVGALGACGRIGAIEKGHEVHMEITQKGFERYISVGNSLVDMYSKCGSLSEAREVFLKLHVRDVVSWNALVGGFAECGPDQEMLLCFKQMQLEGTSPDAVTFVYVLKACGSLDVGREIHLEVTQKGIERGLLVGSSLVDMYCKCGSLLEAQEVFNKMAVQEIVAWNCLLAGFVEHGYGQKALKCFDQMQCEGVSLNAVTFVSALKACGNMGALDEGQKMHTEITRKGFERDPFICGTLVDLYAKCGSLSEAREVFARLPVRDAVSWNALIGGYAMSREEHMALQCFENMQEQGVMPNAVTFTCLLSACSHAGLVLKGQEYFKMMIETYGIPRLIDHYTCMVDLYARSGLLYEAKKFVETIPCPLSEEMWRALLSGCKTYGEAELGLRCFQHLCQMIPEDASSYVLMADIYVSAGRWNDSGKIEELRKQTGVMKKPGSALIEVNKKIHEFIVGSNEVKEVSTLLEMLSSRTKEEGHVPNLDLVLDSISDEKGAVVC